VKLQLDLSPELGQRLRDMAARRGVSVEALAVQMLERHLPPVTISDSDEGAQRIRAAKTLEEAFAIANELPDEGDDDYDVIAALNANRIAAREEPLVPPGPGGEPA